jgi:hypothetical protein
MATKSKKKQADQTIDSASRQLKSGVDYSANKAKDASHKTIDLTRRVKHKAKHSIQKGMKDSGEALEDVGKSIQRAGRNVKKSA